MPENMQSRLLRVLQEREVVPLGGEQSIKVDVSVVSATHRDLKDLITKGRFRQDLYYRLNGLVVTLPPMRERADSVELIARICKSESEDNRPIRLDDEVAEIFRKHPWPGNVRQVQAVLRTAIAMLGDEGIIRKSDLSAEFLEDSNFAQVPGADRQAIPDIQSKRDPPSDCDRVPEKTNLHQMESAFVRRAVRSNNGNISLTATELGVSRNTVYRILRAGDGSAGSELR
jgi:transcriptional regulator of acetoin/glycerol metabolism